MQHHVKVTSGRAQCIIGEQFQPISRRLVPRRAFLRCCLLVAKCIIDPSGAMILPSLHNLAADAVQVWFLLLHRDQFHVCSVLSSSIFVSILLLWNLGQRLR